MELDIWEYLMGFINYNKEKYNLLITCKSISKCKFIFTERVNIELIGKSDWFNHFVNVRVNKRVKLPSMITHLTFDDKFNKSIQFYIPSTVTHLIFGEDFDKPIRGHIPTSVTHLVLGDYWDYSLKIVFLRLLCI